MPLKILPDLTAFQEMVKKSKIYEDLAKTGLLPQQGGASPYPPEGPVNQPSVVNQPYDPIANLLPNIGGVAPDVPGNVSGMPPASVLPPEKGATEKIIGGMDKVTRLIEHLPILSTLLGTQGREAQRATLAPWQSKYAAEQQQTDTLAQSRLWQELMGNQAAAEKQAQADAAAMKRTERKAELEAAAPPKTLDEMFARGMLDKKAYRALKRQPTQENFSALFRDAVRLKKSGDPTLYDAMIEYKKAGKIDINLDELLAGEEGVDGLTETGAGGTPKPKKPLTDFEKK